MLNKCSAVSNSVIKQQTREYKKVLSSLPAHVLKAEYAVRGAIPLRGLEIMQQIRDGQTYPFPKTT